MSKKISSADRIHERFWQIILTRNADFDGLLFFGVKTTGIYCKPSCPARRPKRENVVFFLTNEEAQMAGFRACLRCRPTASGPNPTAELVVRARNVIEENLDSDISLKFLAERLKVSPSHLQRTFKRAFGLSPQEYVRARRFEDFKKQVRRTDLATAMYESGFGSSRALYDKANANLGMSPATYKRGGQGVRIDFTIIDTSLGKLLVAATAKGICRVSFGADDEELQAELIKEFPAAHIEANDGALHGFVRAIVENIEGQRDRIDLPLDLKATAFQMRVWAELRRIPRGETRSYKQIAERIGQPSAVRAVARACATNPVALINPCHRVIGANGELGGYRWGAERKRILLEKEREE